jgi:DNA adenine methylase
LSKLTGRLPEHNLYVELFSGTQTMLFEKLPLFSEVYNDNNNDMVDFFHVIRMDAIRFSEYLKTGNKPSDGVNVDKWERLKEMYEDFKSHMVKGKLSSVSGFREIAKKINEDLIKVEKDMDYIIRRLRAVQFENRRFDDILERFDFTNTLFYIDVTILPADVEVDELVHHLLKLNGKGIIHGADPSKYSLLIDEGWKPLKDEGKWINFKL